MLAAEVEPLFATQSLFKGRTYDAAGAGAGAGAAWAAARRHRSTATAACFAIMEICGSIAAAMMSVKASCLPQFRLLSHVVDSACCQLGLNIPSYRSFLVQAVHGVWRNHQLFHPTSKQAMLRSRHCDMERRLAQQ